MYNSKDLVVDEDLTFLSYNQTINAEFTLEEILDSPLWSINSDNGLIKAIPLFNCDKITSSNSSDKVLDSNKYVILENDMDTIVKCISDDTGSMHYHSVELYAYAPYTKLDVISEVTVYCILHDEYLNALGNVNVDVYIDDELSGSVLSDSNGVCRFKVDQQCTVKFVYGELESNIVVIDEPTHTYSLSIASDKSSILTTESVTLSGQLLMDSSPYTGQSVSLYDGVTLVATLTTDSNGEYEETVSGLSVGTHTFKAVTSNAESSTVTVTVNKITTTTSISASSSSILTTDTLVLTGSVSNASTGSVKIYDGSTLVDEVSLSSGTYNKSLTGLSVGTHTYKAVYDGDSTHSGSESSTVSVTVTEPAPVHDYSLSVVSDKDIISYADGESATLTATLKDNGVVVSGETLSYEIKHGQTTIDTGTGTTDNNGQVEIGYTGTGVGDVQVIVSYGSLLQETYEVQDCHFYGDMNDVANKFLSTNYVSGRTIYYQDNAYTDDVEVEFKFKNNIPSNFLLGFGDTRASSNAWAKLMYYNNNGSLQCFIDNSYVSIGSVSTSVNTVFKLTSSNLHTISGYLDNIKQIERDTSSSHGLKVRLDSYTSTPIELDYLKIKAL